MYHEIDNKMKELNIKKNKRDKKEIIANNLKEIENIFDIIIPQDLKYFLTTYNSIKIKQDLIFKGVLPSPYANKNGYDNVGLFNSFANFDSIKDTINSYKERIPTHLIPIIDVYSGSKICIGINEENFNELFFWDAQNELVAYQMIGEKLDIELNKYKDNLFLISKSFTEFIKLWEIENLPNSTYIKPISIWLSDDL